MTLLSRRVLLAVAAAALGLGPGCDPATLTYFLMPEQRIEAKMKHLPSDDDKKEPRVAILTWTGLETRAEFINADRQLTDLLARQLKTMAETSKEKIAFVPSRKVDAFKNENPSWRGMDLADVGRKLAADYVIYLEINSLSLYERGHLNQLLRGRANITVNLIDVHKPDEAPVLETYSCLYPGEGREGVPVDMDTQPLKFRQEFLARVAQDLSLYFSKYPRSERYRMD